MESQEGKRIVAKMCKSKPAIREKRQMEEQKVIKQVEMSEWHGL